MEHRCTVRHVTFSSATLEDQDRHLSEIKINEMLRLVCHVRPKVAPDDAMPCGIELLIEFFLDESCYVLL